MPDLIADLPGREAPGSRPGRCGRTGSTSARPPTSRERRDRRERATGAGRPDASWSPGSDGFIGSHVVEAVLAAGARRPRVLPLQLLRVGRLARRVRRVPGRLASTGRPSSCSATSATRSSSTRRVDGCRRRAPPRRADRDPVLLRGARARTSRPTSPARSTCSRRCAGTRCRAMVHTSTSEVYGTPEHGPDHRGAPAARPVAVQRNEDRRRQDVRGVRAVLRAHRSSTLRPFNTYGPRQSARAVIPTVLGQLLAGADRGAPRRRLAAARLHVRHRHLRRLRARRCGRPGRPGETVQLGTGSTYSIGEVVDLCLQVTGSTARSSPTRTGCDRRRSEVRGAAVGPEHAPRTGSVGRQRFPSRTALRRTAEWLAPRVDADDRRAVPPMSDPARRTQHRRARARAGRRGDRVRVTSPRSDRSSSRFEQEFAAAVGARYAVACASGTAAIHVGLVLLGVGPGDLVRGLRLHVRRLVQPGALPGRRRGARRLRAGRPGTSTRMLLADWLKQRAASGAAMPKVVEVVHVLGQPARLADIVEICAGYDIAVLEDAAESLGRGLVGGSAGRAADRDRRADRRILLQRQQDRHHGRRRDDRHRRRGARGPGQAPHDPGQGAGHRVSARRDRLQLPADQPRGGPGRGPAGAAAGLRAAQARDRRALRRGVRRDRARAAAPDRPASTRRTGSTRCSCRPGWPAAATGCSTTSTGPGSGPARCGGRCTPSRRTPRTRGSAVPSAPISSPAGCRCPARPISPTTTRPSSSTPYWLTSGNGLPRRDSRRGLGSRWIPLGRQRPGVRRVRAQR